MTKVVFPSFRDAEYSQFEMRQLVSALELRFQSIESEIQPSVIPDTTGGIDPDDGPFAPLVHTHVVADITDFPTSIFFFDDVTGTPALNDTLIWNGTAFETAPSGGAVSLALNDLNNVSVPAPNDGEVLTFDTGSGQWIAQTSSAAFTSFFDLTDTDLAGQDQGDFVFNATGTLWTPTFGQMTWQPSGPYLQFTNVVGVNWFDNLGISIELLDFEAPTGSGPAIDFQVLDGTTQVVTSSATFVDVGSGHLDVPASSLTEGDEYFFFLHAIGHCDNTGAGWSLQVQYDGVTLAGSDHNQEGLGLNLTDPDGSWYNYCGTFTATATGDLTLQHRRGHGSGDIRTNVSNCFLINTTQTPSFTSSVNNVDILISDGGDDVWADAGVSFTLAAGDWLVFMTSIRQTGANGAVQQRISINDGTNDWELDGRQLEDSSNDRCILGGWILLKDYAGGTVTGQYRARTPVVNTIDRSALYAISLADFNQSYSAQTLDDVELFVSAQGATEEMLSVNTSSVVGGDYVVLTCGLSEAGGTTAKGSIQSQIDINSAGASKISTWQESANHRSGAAGSGNLGHSFCLASPAQTLTNGDDVTFANYQHNPSSNFATQGIYNPGVVAIQMAEASAETPSFTVGDPGYATELDGTLIGLKNGIGVNWDNVAGDNVEHLIFQNAVAGGTPATDPDIGSVTFLASFDNGTTGAETYTPEIGPAMEWVLTSGSQPSQVDGEVSVTQSKFVGGKSLFSKDTSGAPSAGWQTTAGTSVGPTGTEDFTIEVDFYITDRTSAIELVNKWDFGTFQWSWSIDTANPGRVNASVSSNGTTLTPIFGSEEWPTESITNNTWHTLAFVRDGSDWYLFLNGEASNNSPVSNGISIHDPGSTQKLVIGQEGADDGSGTTEVFFDNVRITEGVARYITDYTPQTTPYQGTSGTETFIIGDSTYRNRIDGLVTSFSGNVDFDGLLNDINGGNLRFWSPDDTQVVQMNMGNDDVLRFEGTVGDEYVEFDAVDVRLRDNRELHFGTGDDVSVVFDGTELNLTTAANNQINIAETNTRVVLPNATDVTPSTTAHAFQIGLDSAQNMRMDAGEILALVNGTPDTLGLQADGGSIFVAFNAGPTAIELYNNSSIEFQGASDTDFALFAHDNTDFNITTANTSNINIGETGTRVLLPSTSDTSLVSTNHPFQIGPDNAGNLRLDRNEIMAIDNGAATTLFIQADGGTATFFNNTGGDVQLRNATTLSIFDSTNADSGVFSHDGTDFIGTFTGTTDWQITGLNSIVLNSTFQMAEQAANNSPAAAYGEFWVRNDTPNVGMFTDDAGNDMVIGQFGFGLIPDGTVTHSTLRWDGSNWVESGTLLNEGSGIARLDANANSTSIFRIGENTTLRGDNQDAQLILYGEQGGAIASGQLVQTGSNFQMVSGGTSNIQFSSGGGFVNVISGDTFRVWDSTNTDRVEMSHDGDDFNFTFVSTVDVNFTGAGDYRFDEDISITGGGFHVAAGASDPGLTTTVAFVDVNGGVGRFGAFNWDTTTWQPTSLSGISVAINAQGDGTLNLPGDNTLNVTGIGNQFDFFDGCDLVLWDAGDTDNIRFAHTGTNAVITTVNTDGILIGETGTRMLLPSASDQNLASTDHPFQIGLDNTQNIRIDNNEIQSVVNGAIGDLNLQTDGGQVTIGAATAGTFRMREKAAAFGAAAAFGEFWVRNDTPNTPMFTDDAGTDYVLNAAGGGGNVSNTGTPLNNQIAVWTDATTIEGDAQLTWDGTTFEVGTVTGTGGIGYRLDEASGLSVVPGTTTGGWARGLLTERRSDDVVIAGTGWLGTNETMTSWHVGFGASWWATDNVMSLTPAGLLSVEGTVIDVDNSGAATTAVLRARDSTGGIGLAVNGSGAGQIQQLTSAGALEDIWISMARNGGVSLRYNNVAQVSTGALGTQMDLPIYMFERASANTDSGGFGQFWVRNDSPNTPMFTDDTGVDYELNAGGSQTPWTSNIDGDGFDLNDAGVIFMREQASANTDVTNQGQWWVRQDTTTSQPTPYFTSEDGVDKNLLLNEWRRKNSATSRTNTVSITADPDLVVPVPGAGIYEVFAMIHVDAGSTTPDLRFGLYTTSFDTNVSQSRWVYVEGVNNAVGSQTFDNFVIIQLTTQDDWIKISGIVRITGSTNIELRWSQNTSSADFTRIDAGSYLRVTGPCGASSTSTSGRHS